MLQYRYINIQSLKYGFTNKSFNKSYRIVITSVWTGPELIHIIEKKSKNIPKKGSWIKDSNEDFYLVQDILRDQNGCIKLWTKSLYFSSTENIIDIDEVEKIINLSSVPDFLKDNLEVGSEWILLFYIISVRSPSFHKYLRWWRKLRWLLDGF